MSYDLGFSADFMLAEGEPNDRSDLALNANGQPISVWSAICKLKQDNPNEWANMAEDIFNIAPQYLTEEKVLEKIEETNTCSNLSSPVTVWVDKTGSFYVKVYE